RRIALVRGSVISRGEYPIEQVEYFTMVDGRAHVGAFQKEPDYPGGRFMRISGIKLYLRGQAASGTATPESDILRAAGMSRAGVTGFTHALGDIHLATETPAGDTVPIPTVTVHIDGLACSLINVVCEVEFVFPAGKCPY